MSHLRIAFAGDRDIAVWVLEFILSQGVRPLLLMVPEEGNASHANELTAMCPFLASEHIIRGKQFREMKCIHRLRQLNLDFIVGVHFPYKIPDSLLDVPREGILNLHPALLPYNRGWHTPSWAILEKTPIGATLHFMDAGIDRGDILHQKEVTVSEGDTAHSLYQSLKRLELEVFKEAWPSLVARVYCRQPQSPTEETMHKRRDLFAEAIQLIDLEETILAGDLIRRLRALTTNNLQEAAYYDAGGKRFRIQVLIQEENSSG